MKTIYATIDFVIPVATSPLPFALKELSLVPYSVLDNYIINPFLDPLWI